MSAPEEDDKWPGASEVNMTREEAAEALAQFVASPELAELAELAFKMADPFVVGEHWVARERTAEQIAAENKIREETRAEGAEQARIEVGESLDFPIEPDFAITSLEIALERALYSLRMIKKSLNPDPMPKYYAPPEEELGDGIA